MNTKKLLVISTCHLHPLEAGKINDVSILFDDTTNLISISFDVIDECNRKYLVCLAELLYFLKINQFEYVMFDSDAETDSEIKQYNW